MRLHHCFVIIAQIGQDALVTAWALKDANTLSMPQQPFMEIIDRPCILW